REAARVQQLRGFPELHGRGGIDQQVQTEVLLVHKELRIQAVEAPVNVPIDVADVVPDAVGPVVGELDARTLARALALALDAPAEGSTRDQREALELGEKVRRQQLVPGSDRRHAAISRPAPGSTPSPETESRAAPAHARWTPPSSSGTGRGRRDTASGTAFGHPARPCWCRCRLACRVASAP